MHKKIFVSMATFAATSLLLSACGSGGSDGAPDEQANGSSLPMDPVSSTGVASSSSAAASEGSEVPAPVDVLTGVFSDSPVANVTYTTETQSGETNSDGEYQYLEGETVVFSVGEMVLPEVNAQRYVTPLELAGTDDVTDQEVVNIARMLQTLDEDGDPENGIRIPDGAEDVVRDVEFDVSPEAFEADEDVQHNARNSGGERKDLISRREALEHFTSELIESGDASDTDSDEDGVPDIIDFAPDNPEEAFDSDNDGVGDNEDLDDDNDNIPDDEDFAPRNGAVTERPMPDSATSSSSSTADDMPSDDMPSEEEPVNDDPVDEQPADDMPGDEQPSSATDITDGQFEDSSVDCTDYAGTYYATDALDFVSWEDAGSPSDASAYEYDANLVIAVNDEDDTCSFTSNVMPNHIFNDQRNGINTGFANAIAAQDDTVFTIEQNPVFNDGYTDLSVSVVNGIMLNGVVVDQLAGECWEDSSGESQCDEWREDPFYSGNRFILDTSNAHTQSDGTYHYHGAPNALFGGFDSVPSVPSGVIGFAADGFPIYGPFILDDDGVTVRAVTSGYRLVGDTDGDGVSVEARPGDGVDTGPGGMYDGTYRQDYEWHADHGGDLDECNGRWDEFQQYGYHVTESYPYVMACFIGVTHESFGSSGRKNSSKTGGLHSGHIDGHPH